MQSPPIHTLPIGALCSYVPFVVKLKQAMEFAITAGATMP